MTPQEQDPGRRGFLYAFPEPDLDLQIDLSDVVTGFEPILESRRAVVMRRLTEGFRLVPFQISLQVRRHLREIELSRGAKAQLVYLEGRPRKNPTDQIVDIVTQEFTWTRSAVHSSSQATTQTMLFGPRGRPHGDGHVVLGTSEPQLLTAEYAQCFLAVLAVLGHSYEAFFNSPSAASHPDRLHCHYWKEHLPIFDIAQPLDWPVTIVLEDASDLRVAAKRMATIAGQWSSRGCDVDFAFCFAEKSFQIVALPRVCGRKTPVNTLNNILDGGYETHFSTFGVLEAMGYLVAIRTIDALKRLIKTPQLYAEALQELGVRWEIGGAS